MTSHRLGYRDLPEVKNKLQAHTNTPVMTAAVASEGLESQPQPSDALQRIAGPESRSILIQQPSAGVPMDQLIDASCVVCGCDAGDSSADLIKKAWDALSANKGGMDQKNSEKALACAKVTIAKFVRDADEQQAVRLKAGDCKKTPTAEGRDAYFSSNWALSDVAAAWFIRGQVLAQQKNCQEAKEAYQTIVAKYNCAYIWDTKGWFWSVAIGTDEKLKHLETNGCK